MAYQAEPKTIKTRILCLAGTHNKELRHLPHDEVDLVLHCGDLTKNSKVAEYQEAIQQLAAIKAPLKIVIHGPNDITLDENTWIGCGEAMRPRAPAAVRQLVQRKLEREHVLQMVKAASEDGIRLITTRGTQQILLRNGAFLTLHARPYNRPYGCFADLKYEPSQVFDFDIGHDVDVVMSSYPPLGVLDEGRDGALGGCPNLFSAIALGKPKVHCFGHAHGHWGAKMVKWQDGSTFTMKATHLTAINHRESYPIELAQHFKIDRADSRLEAQRKKEHKRHCEEKGYVETRYPEGVTSPFQSPTRTLFVNATVRGDSEDSEENFPWLVELDLPCVEHRTPIDYSWFERGDTPESFY
ncbi:hypothetical protein SODALDRAFT_26689 [Sodiomyces alkalinus F11]|uniref:Calcineurin-like phosphoesterase domain-containing protein n=1 Tax=Sodiomyces alkalinus (strain CBS 110278 / VKM F-3762 / F11) TaxID=1314773 RepID=A0A3N2Q8H9_SODAK|nr:hypothetical protein SODALDRAFT_26689 [Sodiomyces alkalinus F11]ROT42925.1 hypothetical protein SODALDRAFT_26689 [Sodiomyces alkalinus F11]